MSTKIKLLTLLVTLFTVSCAVPNNQNTKDDIPKPNQLTRIWIDYANHNQQIFNNSVSRDKYAPIVRDMLIDSLKQHPEMLCNIPLEFMPLHTEPIRLSDGIYMVKASLISAWANDKNINYSVDYQTKELFPPSYDEGDYQVSFDLFFKINEDALMQMEDGEYYYMIDCTFKGNVNEQNIYLPRGRKVEQRPSIYCMDTYTKEYSVNLGGLYVENPKFKKANIK